MLTPFQKFLPLLFLTAATANTFANNKTSPLTDHYSDKAQEWFSSASHKAEKKAKQFKIGREGKAKNIILFIGDGMGISTITAARIFAGQKVGLAGEEYELSFDKFPYTGLSRTYNTNQQTPDSAGTMTAIITGVKTKAGILSISEDVIKGDCQSGKEHHLLSALELAELAGKSTGIISTARVTHATPGATYAKSANRDWEDDSDMPSAAKNNGCKDIADQLINFRENLQAKFPEAKNINGLEVALGGGRRHFLPKHKKYNSSDAVSDVEGDRTDGRNLVEEWQNRYPSGQMIFTAEEFYQLPKTAPFVFGLFNESHMRYEANRKNDIAGEPSLAEMTSKAIDIVSKNKKGFFLMVESGRIDHAHHAGNAFNALNEVLALSEAVEAAAKKTSEKDTLIIVTADHSHVFTMAGYPTRGNPILGKVISNDEQGNPKQEFQKDADGNYYTTLGYINGRGHAQLGEHTDADAIYHQPINTGRKDLSKINTTLPGYHQEALVPRESETHGGEDVAIYARGPGAALVSGSHEQNYIFHVMNYAGGLEKQAQKQVK